jgi:hypothetical protein
MCRAPLRWALALILLLAACEEEDHEASRGQTAARHRRLRHCLRDRAPFTIIDRAQLKFRERVTFRRARNKTEKFWVPAQLFGNETISFILTSFVTLPIFSCCTRHDQ